jgi:hypothetical protein
VPILFCKSQEWFQRSAEHSTGSVRVARLRNRGDELALLVKDDPDWLEPHVELAALYYRPRRPEDPAKERQIVDSLSAKQQAQGRG